MSDLRGTALTNPVSLWTRVLSRGSVMFIHPFISPCILSVREQPGIAMTHVQRTYNWEIFSSRVMRGRRSLIRASIEALGFLYVGIEPSLLNWRASTLKCRLSRTSAGSWAAEKGEHHKKIYRSKKLPNPAMSEANTWGSHACFISSKTSE